MFVIALINSKGGCGKSTLCCNLAVAALTDKTENFNIVSVVDLDPQHTLYN